MNNLQTKINWIDIRQSLPKVGEYVLISKEGEVDIGELAPSNGFHDNENTFLFYTESNSIEGVEFWAILPNAPKERKFLAIDLGKPVKIDLGAGVKNKKTPLDEWIHLDCFEGEHIEIVCDFSEIPLPNGIADEIFSGDTIEHIRTDLTDKTLREWNRILKIGGVFTGRTPNLISTMIRYTNKEITLEQVIGALYGSQEDLTQQHYITYTPETLKSLLDKYGFGCIDLSESPGSDDPMNAWWICWTCQKLKSL